MIKFLQWLTTPVFYLGVVWYIVFRFPFYDSRMYATYLVTDKWREEDPEQNNNDNGE